MSSSPKYQLADVEARAKQYPTFDIPSHNARYGVQPRHLVKLCFKDDLDPGEQPAAERMWVEVQAQLVDEENGMFYLGKLICDPMMVRGLAIGDLVRFEPRHVIAIEPPDTIVFAAS